MHFITLTIKRVEATHSGTCLRGRKCISVTEFGQFLKVFGDMVSIKASPNAFLVIFWAKEKSNTFHGNLLWLLFGQLLVKFGLLFDSASGHCGNA